MTSPRRWLAPLLLGAAACARPAPARHFLAEEPQRPRGADVPRARRSSQLDSYHGYDVPDPYRWLEDADSEETRAWIEAENAATSSYLDRTGTRDRLRERLEELWSYGRRETPVQEGGRIFFLSNDGRQDQSVLYVADSAGGRARLLLDPNGFSRDRTVALATFVPSPSGRLLAYATSDGGSDWRTWRVLDVDSGTHRSDVIGRSKFGGLEWAPDESGFFYSRYDRPAPGTELAERNAPPDVCFHLLGTAEDSDTVVVPRPEQPGILPSFSLTDDGKALVVSRRDARTRKNELDLVPIEALGPPEDLAGWSVRRAEASSRPEVIPLARGYDAQYAFLGGGLDRVWVSTDLDAPRWKVLAILPARPERESWQTVVAQAGDAIESADLVGGRLVVQYLDDATSRVEVFDPSGTRVHSVDLPGIGSVTGFQGDPEDRETYFAFTSFTTPTTIYRYDLQRAETRLWFAPDVDFDPEAYETRQVFFSSKDGTRIPMFVTFEKGLHLDGSNPTYLFGYGGFGISMKPAFSVPNVVWMERGGVLAVPNLRGGGEYGEAWHEAGTKLKKQNVFDDFVAAAEYLIESGYTSKTKLAIGGRSNGGLLVGACMTQRPDLFAAAVPTVGVLDMLRYQRFTIGWAWAGDYGTSDDPDEFRALLEYSPYHNVHPGTAYPATLVMTADHDDRVVPAHSFKFAAALQEAQAGRAPILIRIETRAGHGAGTPISKRIEEEADRMAFLLRELHAE